MPRPPGRPPDPQRRPRGTHPEPAGAATQRIALGTGIGAGVTAAGVYFGPLLVGVLTSMAISLAVVALVAVATAWGLVTVVRTVAQDGDQATKNLRKARRRVYQADLEKKLDRLMETARKREAKAKTPR
ncbi:DUF6251 family protein [Streptomyces albidoflavus]|uniref:DUF6251 family protein n=1 Tax=Streptomyces albidoflavus TaxID=1886 RepID=UPI00068F52F1|nr:DUF6251 family protein [Streptomyces albidoflavus]